MGTQKRSYLFCKFFLIALIIHASVALPHDFCINAPLAVNAGMQATIGCGSGAAIGCSFGPVGTACGLVIGGLISFLVNKCTPRVDRKNDNIWFNKSHIDAKKVAAKQLTIL